MLKPLAKRVLRKLGYDFRRLAPSSSETVRFMAMLSEHHVNLVFDIGANTGQFGRSLREWGYRGRIVSFEPLCEAWERLRKAVRPDPLWEVARRAAIGAEDGEIEIHVSGNSFSSSALNMLDAHRIVAPDAAYVSSESVPLRRLDSIGSGYVSSDSVLFVKADVQGFEAEVLKGARNLLKMTVGLHLELSLVPLYEGQCEYNEMIGGLKEQGFELWDVSPELVDPRSGRVLQVNATFFRN